MQYVTNPVRYTDAATTSGEQNLHNKIEKKKRRKVNEVLLRLLFTRTIGIVRQAVKNSVRYTRAAAGFDGEKYGRQRCSPHSWARIQL
ncbi:unnamed protein product [Brassica rapa subsp. trilocularis]